MKTIRTIALLAFSIFAVCGEAATGWPSEFNDVNNLYLEIFVDANHYMLARLGEDPNLSITLNHLEYDPEFPDEPLYYYYDVDATVEFKDGYIAPFHEGPDPVSAPEPTSGMLLLVGLAAISLRRRA